MIHHLHRHAWIYTRQSVLGWSNRKANGDPLFSKNIGPAKHTLPCVDQSDQPEVEKTGDQKANGVALLLLRYPMSIEPNKNYVLGSMEVEQRMVWDQICQKLQIGPCDIRTYWVTRWFQPIFKRYSSTWESSPNRDEHDKLPWNYDVANVLCGICHGYIEEISKSEVSEIQQDLSTSILPLWVYQRFQSMNVTAELNLFLSILLGSPKRFKSQKCDIWRLWISHLLKLPKKTKTVLLQAHKTLNPYSHRSPQNSQGEMMFEAAHLMSSFHSHTTALSFER